MSLYEIKKKLTTLVVFEKATYAMKIVSSSLHAKIKKNLSYYQKLKNQLEFLKQDPFTEFHITDIPKMYIFVGAERGFCGDYNLGMFRKFNEITKQDENKHIPCILIGKAFIEKIKKKSENIFCFNEFKEKFFFSIEKKIKKIAEEKNIAVIEIFSYESKSIGNKELIKTTFYTNTNNLDLKKDFFTGHFSKESIMKKYQEFYTEILLNYLFRMAFLTEQGIRFISMDAALKNTKEAISDHKKLYFKTRQENINKQLQDLGVSLLL
jgi:ATP synthase F1 gamma subunit